MTCDTGAKSLESALPTAYIHKDEDNRFIVITSPQYAHIPHPTPVRVEVRRAGTDKVVAVVDRLTLDVDNGGTSELGDDTWWHRGDDQSLVLDEMGDHELDVYAKYRDGKELVRRNAGRSTYAVDARFEASSGRTEFSLDDLGTRVTGTVTAVHPRRGVRLPLAGAKVRVSLGDGTVKLVSTTKYGKLTISGKVAVDGITSQQAPIEIQYQTARGDWETRHSLVVPYDKTFTVTVSQGSRYATRWRVHTPGTSNIGPSTGTRVIHQTRTWTEFTSVSAAPRPVAKGQQLTVSGVLRTYDPAKGYAVHPGQKVRYYFRPDGSTVTQEMGTSVSLADGAFSKTFTAQTSGYWWIRFVDADATHLATGYYPLGHVNVTG